jgi:hypothetical protein
LASAYKRSGVHFDVSSLLGVLQPASNAASEKIADTAIRARQGKEFGLMKWARGSIARAAGSLETGQILYGR